MDLIERQAAIERATKEHDFFRGAVTVSDKARRDELLDVMCWLGELPSAQPEIIRCNSCKYWTQTTGKMKGYGLGRCDFHDADLVACNGFCYWAERRTDE